MTGEKEHDDEELTPEQLAELDRPPAIGKLLKQALTAEEPPNAEAILLQSVQQKLRKRSRGKFYGDGWSTTHTRFNYALIAAVMLVTIVAVYLALGPTGFSVR